MKIFVLIVTLSFYFSASALANIVTYFNHSPNASYTDPYRNISRYGHNFEAIIIDQIKKANKSVYVAVQELRLPLIAAALIQKKKEGVDVRVVLENNYNFTVLDQRDSSSDNEHEASKRSELIALVDVNRNGTIEKNELETRDAIYMLRKAKIPTMDDTFDGSHGSGLMHHKFIVIDGKTTIVSTANFTMSCIHGDILTPSSRGNANSLVLVQSIAFSKLFVDEFAQLWGNGRRGNFGQNKTYRGPQTVTVRGTKITVQFSPTSKRYNWEESVNGLIGAYTSRATHSINSALFVFSDQRISNAMYQAQSRGAKIGVLIEPKFAFRDYSELLDIMGLQMLTANCSYEPDNNPWKVPAREAGMARLPRGDVMHHKFAVVDRKAVIVGSQNWSAAANYINDETLLVIHNTAISDLYTREYERLKRNALLGPPKYLVENIRSREAYCANRGFNY